MIRVLFGSALPVLGLGLVAAFAGPDLVTGPRGAPMIVADQPSPSNGFARARFDGEACASRAVLGEDPRKAWSRAGVRVVAIALRPDGEEMEMAVKEPDGPVTETVALLFDEKGKLVAVSRPHSLQPAASDCLKPPAPAVPGTI